MNKTLFRHRFCFFINSNSLGGIAPQGNKRIVPEEHKEKNSSAIALLNFSPYCCRRAICLFYFVIIFRSTPG